MELNEYQSFEEYVEDRHEIKKAVAHQTINVANFCDDLRESDASLPLPTTIRQVKELHRLKESPDKSTANQTSEVANFCDDLREADASLPRPTTIRSLV